MKLGDLIRDKKHPKELGMIVEIERKNALLSYRVLNLHGDMTWFSRYYIEKGCEPVKENKK